MHSSPYLSVIIPAYRQARTICHELFVLKSYFDETFPSYEIILVIDGNEDNTFEAVTSTVSFPELHVECFTHNQGKGAAVRHGLNLAQGKLIAFIDAGGELQPADLKHMIDEMEMQAADIVIGSKRHVSSQVSYPKLRRAYSSVYQLLNRLLFKMEIRDTQVGMKLFRREVLQAILPLLVVERFAFDLELLVVAYNLGFNRIIEAPVTLQYQFSSSISWRSVYQMLWDTLLIFYRSRILHSYRQSSRLQPPIPTLSPILIRTKAPNIQTQKTQPPVRVRS
jgi:glycosyltransferase involved in cell wall biosynthesis